MKEILSNKIVVDYLHPDSKNRSTLYLVKNDLCNFSGKVGKINVICTEEVTAIKNINYLKVISIKKIKEEKSFPYHILSKEFYLKFILTLIMIF